MASMICKCGEKLSDQLIPNDIQLIIYTDKEWDIITSSESIDPLKIKGPEYDVWRCPKCERLYFFKDGVEKAVKIYKIEK